MNNAAMHVVNATNTRKVNAKLWVVHRKRVGVPKKVSNGIIHPIPANLDKG